VQAPCGGRAGEGGAGDAGTFQPGSDVVLVVPVSVESACAVAGGFSSASVGQTAPQPAVADGCARVRAGSLFV
jgi:hypothetical protein